MIKEEIKSSLKDWMTATSQLLKAGVQNKIDVDDITFWWRSKFGIRMKSKWIEKALYGSKGIKGKGGDI